MTPSEFQSQQTMVLRRQNELASKFYDLVRENSQVVSGGVELNIMVRDLLDDVEFPELMPKLDCYAADLSKEAFALYSKLLARSAS